ncbi:MAG: isochorismate synthase [Calditrichaeota bacterium]|nr:MAG: isochorismate synthase [Calditrichota bacterium]
MATEWNKELSRTPPGFVVAPFAGKRHRSFIIRNHLYFRASDGPVEVDEDGMSLSENRTRFEQTIYRLAEEAHFPEENQSVSDALAPGATNGRLQSTRQEAFCSWVEEALEEIRKSRLTKVVLSRTEVAGLHPRFSPVDLFLRLSDAYTNAFVSLVWLPGVGLWLGATPELLLRVNNDELRTVSLAGTRSMPPEADFSVKNWGEKELVEQAIVSRYIRRCFETLGIRDFQEEGPETVRIGNILHLQTSFRLKQAGGIANAADRLLWLLHPTPAVCGVPKAAAQAFIASKEAHDRAFYSGFLGPVNFSGESRLFVNLRCLQVVGDRAVIYAGAGITAESQPAQEWLETELKTHALLKYLRQVGYAQRSRASASEVDPKVRALCDE